MSDLRVTVYNLIEYAYKHRTMTAESGKRWVTPGL